MVLHSFYVAVNQTEGRVGLAQLKEIVSISNCFHDSHPHLVTVCLGDVVMLDRLIIWHQTHVKNRIVMLTIS